MPEINDWQKEYLQSEYDHALRIARNTSSMREQTPSAVNENLVHEAWGVVSGVRRACLRLGFRVKESKHG